MFFVFGHNYHVVNDTVYIKCNMETFSDNSYSTKIEEDFIDGAIQIFCSWDMELVDTIKFI